MNLTELDKCNMFERMNDKTFVSVPAAVSLITNGGIILRYFTSG